MDRKVLKQASKNLDYGLLIITIITAVFGMVVINSAAHSFSNAGRIMFSQGIAFGIGLVGIGIILFIDYDFLGRIWKFILGACVVLLVITLFIGKGKSEVGTTGWIYIGSQSFQPSEIVKIGFIITFARHISLVQEDLNLPRNIILLLLHAGLYTGLVILQNDFGTAMVFVFITVCMLFIAGISYKYVFLAIGAALVSAPVIWAFLKPYQRNRIFAFLNPEENPLGYGYHVIQSKIAIGSGQIIGRGYMEGTQTQMEFLPAKHTDFIFAVIGEEFGFVGAAVVIVLLFTIVLLCINNAKKAADPFGELICVGASAMFLFHIVENIGMCIGIMPVTGIPLPFISAGGTNLLTSLIAIGLVLNVRLRSNTMING